MDRFLYKKKIQLFFLTALLLLMSFLVNLYYPLETFTWRKFKSSRVPLSFSYPSKLPVTQCGDEWLGIPMQYVEHIDFATTCDSNMYIKKAGYINVKKTAIKGDDPDPTADFPKSSFPSGEIVYKKVQIGNRTAYQKVLVGYNDLDLYYFIFSQGLEYQLHLDRSSTMTDREIRLMLKTFRFQN